MLKLIHVQARLSTSKGKAVVKQMSVGQAEDYTRAAEIIAIFEAACAERITREKLTARLTDYAGTRLDYREIDGLAKVISDSFATFEPGGAGLLIPPQSVSAASAEPDSEAPLEAALNVAAEPDEAEPDANLTALRLAVWKEAAQAEFYAFNNPNLTVALKPGVQSLRRAAGAYDAELLNKLMPQATRLTLLERAAQQTGYTLKNPDPEVDVANLLFGDIPAQQRLVALSAELNVENLLNRYNVELLRGVLYLAPRLRIVVRDRYKDLFKFIKLFGLMHEVRPVLQNGQVAESMDIPENQIAGYEILLEGAASPFLARTDRRYGIQFARFLPALLLCEAEWELETELVFGWVAASGKGKGVSKAAYTLGPQPHLRSHFKASGEFDSLLEASLAVAFEKRFKQTTRQTAPAELPETESPEVEQSPKKKSRKKKHSPDARQGWVIKREDRIVPVFDTVMIPDFAFEHTDGRRALLEVVGFWERGYLERKIAKLNRAGRSDIIVLVSERTRCGRENFLVKGQTPPYQLIFFKGTPRLGVIIEALERCAVALPTTSN